MKRSTFIRNTALTAAGLLVQRRMIAQLFNMQEWKITMLRDNVGYFTERGGTIGFVLDPEGIVVVDSQFPDQANHLITELKNRSAMPIRYLINTHHHGDHSGGNIAFKGIAGNIVAHENSLANQKRVAESQNALDKTLLPDMTFKEEWKTKLSKEKIKLDYFGAAHTNGDAIIHFEEANITHMGDLMFNRRHPYIDKTAGANISNWIKVLEKAQKKFDKDTIYIFGHAGDGYQVTGTTADLSAFANYLGQVLKFAESEVKAGKSKEEFLKNTSIPGNTEWKGDGIQRPLTAAWEEVTTGK